MAPSPANKSPRNLLATDSQPCRGPREQECSQMPALPCATSISQKAAFLLTLKPQSSYLQTSPGREDKPHFPLTTSSRLGGFFSFFFFFFFSSPLPPLFFQVGSEGGFSPFPNILARSVGGYLFGEGSPSKSNRALIVWAVFCLRADALKALNFLPFSLRLEEGRQSEDVH